MKTKRLAILRARHASSLLVEARLLRLGLVILSFLIETRGILGILMSMKA